MLKDTLNADVKAAMLAREADKVETLKGLKSAILYAEVAAGKRDEGLNDQEIIAVFKKESKKRQDSIDLYDKAGDKKRADKEREEKALIDAYLPEQLSDEKVQQLIVQAMAELEIEHAEAKDMGKIIGAVKQKAGAEVDGSTLAHLVKERIAQQ